MNIFNRGPKSGMHVGKTLDLLPVDEIPNLEPAALTATRAATQKYSQIARMTAEQEHESLFLATVLTEQLTPLINSLCHDLYAREAQAANRRLTLTSGLLFTLAGFTTAICLWYATWKGWL